MNISQKGKGLLIKSKDPRDLLFKGLMMEYFSIDWNKGFDVEKELGITLKVEDQGQSQSCVGQSWAKYAEATDTYENRKFTDLSARDIYSRIWVAPDGGAYGYKGGSLLLQRGIPTEARVLSYQNGSPPTEAFMRIRDESLVVAEEALMRKIKGYATVDTSDINEMAYAIQYNRGVVFGVLGSNEGWQTGYPRPPLDGEEVWGHFLYAIGFGMLNGKKGIFGLNSWSKDWGQNGHFFLSADYFTSGWTLNGYTLVDLPNNWLRIINMLDLIQIAGKPDQWVKVEGNRFRIPDYETKLFLRDKLKIILDTPRIVSEDEFKGLNDGGVIPSRVVNYKLADIYSVLRDAFEENV